MTEENNQEPTTETQPRETGFDTLVGSGQVFHGRRLWAAITAILLVIAISWLSVIDRKTENYVNDAIVQALTTYGSLRVANGVISVIKTAEFDVQIASVGLGAMADPVDDLVEDGSNVMRMAIASLIIQKLMVEIVSANFFKILLTVTGLLLIGSLFIKGGRYSGFCMKAFALAGLARFLLVLVVFLNGMASQAFVAEKTEATQQKLSATSEKLGQVQQKAGGGVNKEERTKIQSEINALTDQQERLLESVGSAESAVNETAAELEASQSELSNLQEEKGLVEQYFPEESEHQALVNRVEEDEQAHEQAIAELEGYTEELSQVNEQIVALKATLRGEGKGWIAAATEKVNSAKEMLNFSTIKNEAEAMVDAILRLMALFVLKTVIIPIIFLVLLLQGFRYIWGIDARTLASQQWESAKGELSS
ncbi:hypothetical protein DES49_0672 [Halospina denitrificans]|uniref:Uncharacterized protein n=1 Tax=Halospina denitrificans TaxID=332522 RepID=A0A4R7K164_9GAMM|nr:hypothetical protein [Halospina denitrificans]TDT44561.1 hypothetical protein DES49_0672 [Halospina denitrificans]